MAYLNARTQQNLDYTVAQRGAPTRYTITLLAESDKPRPVYQVWAYFERGQKMAVDTRIGLREVVRLTNALARRYAQRSGRNNK